MAGMVSQVDKYPRQHPKRNKPPFENMAVFTVFTHSESTKYKTTLCSKSMVFVALTTILTVFLPLLFAYRSQGFWVKTLSYREQPVIHFKNEYFVYLGTETNDVIICTTIRNPTQYLQELDHCGSIAFNEEDANSDGTPDKLRFDVKVDTPLKIDSVFVILVFDVLLQTTCLAQFESIAVVQTDSSSKRKNHLEILGDLELTQRTVLPCRGRYLQYNQSAFADPHLDIHQLVLKQALQNVSTRFSPRFTQWWRQAGQDGFSINLEIMYTEATINYRPGFWPVIKWAWMQYLPILAVFVVVHRWVKKYVFLNRLLPAVPDKLPKKAYN